MAWTKLLKYVGIGLMIAAIMAVGFKIGDWWSTRKSADEISKLSVQLSQSAETLELTTGLYSKKVIAYENLAKFLVTKTEDVIALRKQLDDSKSSLLTAQQLTIKWKKAYEAALAANQTEEPIPDPVPGDPVRKRIDFNGNLGPIRATGHTITDPAEAYLKLEQVVPLVLTVAVAQNKDGTWTSYVASSDSEVDVKINLAGVNPLILSQKWYQKIWLDLGAVALGDPGASVGLSYRGERYSVGATCLSTGDASGCGATLGFRIFK
jgi:hypothetical protein